MSQHQFSSKAYQTTDEEGQSLIPSQAEYYLNSVCEWRNIQDIIRLTFKSIVDIVKVQGQSIKDIEQSLLAKASKGELTAALNLKANNAEIMRVFSEMTSSLESKASTDEMNTLLENKISKRDLIYYLKAKLSTEEVRNMLDDKLDTTEFKAAQSELKSSIEVMAKEIGKRSQFATNADLMKLQSRVDAKMSYADFEESQKTFNESIQLSLMKKANKTDIESKANKDDVMLLASQCSKIDDFLKKREDKPSLSSNDNTAIVSMSKRLDDIDQDLDRLIENVKVQFASFNQVINALEKSKADKDQGALGGSLNAIPRRISQSPHHSPMKSLDAFRSHCKKTFLKQEEEQKAFENRVNEQLGIVVEDVKTAIGDLINQKETLNSFISKSHKEKEGYKQLKQLSQGLSKDYSVFKTKVEALSSELNDKTNVNKIDPLVKKGLECVLPIEISKLKAEIEENFKESVFSEMTKLKVHNEAMINKTIAKNQSVSSNEIIAMLDSLNTAINQKANIKEILLLMKNKAEVDDVNQALVSIHDELDSKISNEKFNEAIDSQALLNEALCAENILGRWHWTGGKIKNGFIIPFETQSVNTASENFLWEKDKTHILVVMPGIYEVILGFYCGKKPTVQLMVNEESILSAVGSGSVLKYGIQGKKGYIAGLTMIEYLLLSENSRVSVSFIGDERAEGFLGIKKL